MNATDSLVDAFQRLRILDQLVVISEVPRRKVVERRKDLQAAAAISSVWIWCDMIAVLHTLHPRSG